MNYLGVVLGIISTLIAIGSLWLGIKNYLWIKNQKTIDIRLELSKLVISTHVLATVVQRTMRNAKGSRTSLLAGSGIGRSSANDIMNQNVTRDTGIVDAIINSLPDRNDTFNNHSDENIIEISRLVHDAHERFSTLKVHYGAELQSDEQQMNRRAQMFRRL